MADLRGTALYKAGKKVAKKAFAKYNNFENAHKALKVWINWWEEVSGKPPSRSHINNEFLAVCPADHPLADLDYTRMCLGGIRVTYSYKDLKPYVKGYLKARANLKTKKKKKGVVVTVAAPKRAKWTDADVERLLRSLG